MLDGLPGLENECFFIAPIGSEGSSERVRSDGVLKFIVDRAAKELGLTAVRADQISDPGQITLQVIDHILGARAAVADVTGLNPNVFYELAVRHTAQLPVVIIAEKSCQLPFDIAQMRTIFFESTNLLSADQAHIEIVAQLRRALDSGAVDSPITASVDVRSLAGGSAVERNIAELVQTVEDINKSQRDLLQRVSLIYSKGIHGRDPHMVRDAIVHLVGIYADLDQCAKNLDNTALANIVGDLSRPIRYLARRYDIVLPNADTPTLFRRSGWDETEIESIAENE